MVDGNEGIRKAAILANSLELAAADALLEQMTDDQAQLVRQAMVELGEVDPDEERRVVDEFLRVGPMIPRQQEPGIELNDRVAEQLSLGADAIDPCGANDRGPNKRGQSPLPRRNPFDPHVDQAKINKPCRQADEPPFCFLHEAEDKELAGILTAERPQAVALVLSHLPPEQAATVLGQLPADMQVEVIRRLVTLEETDSSILRDVEQALRSRLSERVPIGRRRVAGLPAVTEILKAAPSRTGLDIFDNVAARDQQLAERIGPETVDFEDLAVLDSTDWAVIVETADLQLITFALVGAAPDLIERVLYRVPQSQAEHIRYNLNHLEPLRLSDVKEAKCRIANVARRLAATGRVRLPSGAVGTRAELVA